MTQGMGLVPKNGKPKKRKTEPNLKRVVEPTRRSGPSKLRPPRPDVKEKKKQHPKQMLFTAFKVFVVVLGLILILGLGYKLVVPLFGSTDEVSEQLDSGVNDLGLTESQYKAYYTAQEHLDGNPYSEQGLINQLIEDGYGEEDVRAALGEVDVIWSDYAEISAKRYIDFAVPDIEMNNIIAQLKYEGFTDVDIETALGSFDVDAYTSEAIATYDK